MSQICAILFDKDGTLFDFEATWGGWAQRVVTQLGGGDGALVARLAAAIRFDLAQGRFDPGSPVIAGTSEEVVRLLAAQLPGHDFDALVADLDRAAQQAPLVEAVPLAECLSELRARGLRLGLCTNDSEASARAHLRAAGVEELFERIFGYDSGHGAKPEPGPLLAFAAGLGVAPECVAMVGDSRHDLRAARAAGMKAVAVLTGPARAEDLADLADVILPDIGGLACWIGGGAV